MACTDYSPLFVGLVPVLVPMLVLEDVNELHDDGEEEENEHKCDVK